MTNSQNYTHHVHENELWLSRCWIINESKQLDPDSGKNPEVENALAKGQGHENRGHNSSKGTDTLPSTHANSSGIWNTDVKALTQNIFIGVFAK